MATLWVQQVRARAEQLLPSFCIFRPGTNAEMRPRGLNLACGPMPMPMQAPAT